MLFVVLYRAHRVTELADELLQYMVALSLSPTTEGVPILR
jgi:hypothetical protein